MTSPDVSRHPCFNADAKGHCGRVHLPIAQQCNIKCNYCNRKYDCVNESRPGITSAVLGPRQAVRYLEQVVERAPNITVAGIAGPGDAFANPEQTLETLRLVRERFPEMILCLATNGLNAERYVPELAKLQVSHVTVTVNAVDPEVGEQIYRWVRDGKVIYRGRKAAEVLLAKQLAAIKALKAAGIIVKVNTVVVAGINDHHVPEVSQRMAELGVDIQNCMVMYPNSGTPFEDVPEIPADRMAAIRSQAEKVIPQMKHCTRCRADAVGLLGQDRSDEFRDALVSCSMGCGTGVEKPYVAVATLEGALVNLHLGEAHEFQVWRQTGTGFEFIGARPAPEPGMGAARWAKLAELLNDCRAVLVEAMGETPNKVLRDHGILPVEMSGPIEMGLAAIYNGTNLATLKARRKGNGCSRAAGCSGDGEGCG
ncbi:MAG: radical SAM protein [Desulfomonile tiedjei]|nr:radical SAM protein [Desulfomonile tiedjei]